VKGVELKKGKVAGSEVGQNVRVVYSGVSDKVRVVGRDKSQGRQES